MRQIILTFVICCLMGVGITQESESGSSESVELKSSEGKLKVAVYYETLCGDSKRFIKSQLYPVKKSTLGDNFDVELYPYGKATTTPTGDGSYTFSCQHGSEECDGNKMHACALKYIESPETKLEFIYCSMSNRNPPQTLDECSEKVNVVNLKEQIRTCAEGKEGSQLLADNGEKTHALRPKLYFVPWITYNGGFSNDKLENSQNNFKSVVCSELKINGHSVSCNGGISINSSSWLFLITVFLLFQNTQFNS